MLMSTHFSLSLFLLLLLSLLSLLTSEREKSDRKMCAKVTLMCHMFHRTDVKNGVKQAARSSRMRNPVTRNSRNCFVMHAAKLSVLFETRWPQVHRLSLMLLVLWSANQFAAVSHLTVSRFASSEAAASSSLHPLESSNSG